MLGTMGVEVKLPKVKKSRIRKLRNSLASDIDNHDDEDAAHFADISSLEARLPPENTWIRCGYLKKCVFAQEKTWQDRRVVLCKDFLFLERLGDRRVIETVYDETLPMITRSALLLTRDASTRPFPPPHPTPYPTDSSL
eukprot:1935630-Rhodomonas_salina.1